MRALIVEDDPQITTSIRSALQSERFAVDTAGDGKTGSEMARTTDYDLIILDNLLPGRDGLDVCRDIRAAGKSAYILVLSAITDLQKKVTVLDAGADDYLTKPFSLSEFLARTKALMRRLPTLTGDTLHNSQLTLDTRSHTVQCKNRDLALTRKEFSLLEYFMRNKGAVLTRAMIMEHVWGENADPFSNTIETHILSLRKKLSACGGKGVITTVPGVGYRLER